LPEPLIALVKEAAAVRAEYRRKYDALETDEAQQIMLAAEEKARMRVIARKALDLAERHADEPLALAARTWVVNGGIVAWSTPESAEALRLLEEKHLNDAGLGPALLLAPVYSTLPGADRLLRAAWEKSPHRAVRGTACYGLALRLQTESNRAAKDQPTESASKAREAERLLEVVLKDYADVERYRGTIGGDATALLFRIRNLIVGKPAPDFRCTDIEDHEVKFSDLKGRVIVLDFWYVACGPCRAQFPHLRQLVERHAGKPFSVVGISEDEDRSKWGEFLKKEQLPWTQWHSGPKGVVADWSISSFPTYFVIDAKGLIRFINPRGDALDKAVEALLAEAAKGP
jgi:peroxiredoxin